MLKKNLLLLVALLFTGLAFSQRTTAIQCGKLLDVKTGTVSDNQVIVVRDNIIQKIVPKADFKDKVDSIINLSNYFVLPGLIDCHTHVLLQGDITSDDYAAQLLKESIPYRTLRAARSAAIALNNGFTTIRDLETEGAMYADVDVKKAINNGVIPGPRMFVATRAINTVGHYPISPKEYNWELDLPKGIQEVNGADDARKAVREQLAHGADWIKIYADRGYYQLPDGSFRSLPNFTKEEIEAIGDETLKSRKNFAAHAMTRDGILAAIAAGCRSIEHGSGMDEECAKTMAEKGVYWCPTIFVNDYVADGRAKEGSMINQQFRAAAPKIFQTALKAGVKIAYGTDIGGYDWNLPEAKDFEFMVKYGLTPLQAIQTATTTAAELLQQDGKIGVIAPGAYADIIAVKGSPLSNIQLLEQVQWVMKDGKIWKSQ
ncbi:metal-dependent hydrolase family protein [Hydrotalea sandarakina]|jgi:imidazolonepropionase-like amidohydrolase|uniref:Imidazolonepropionase-like amidohydrolase n=1 Tax=Hydrotalea sandarakina TaxID=1004304 RepID=A0A2W7S4K5_9BACT|nr:amidohydrolase family protein [Hydrotalea sandarakina]PZX62207.1 imidazolonepropionase-like amidohydrolase [Hydrotalea sandarakina]